MHPALRILNIPTAPRHEDLVAAFVCDWLNRLGIDFCEDHHGNIVAEYRSGRRKEAIAFSVHMDHPGFEVLAMQKELLHCRFLGGVPRSYFKPGVPVTFFNAGGCRTCEAEIVRIAEWKPEMKIVLLRAKRGQALPKQFGMWKLPAMRWDRKRNRIVARACDDLAGCAAVLAMLESLRKRRRACHVYAIFTRREEIGLCGALELAKSGRLPKSIPIISIETSKMFDHAPQGEGPIVRVGDRSSIFDPVLTKQLCAIAHQLKETHALPFQRKLMDGGTCEATAFLDAGYAASGLCVALGNYHNCSEHDRIASENIHFGDWQALVKLMAATAVENIV